jgi:hypothetical protein
MNDLTRLIDSLAAEMKLPLEIKNALIGAIVVSSFKAKLDVLFELQSGNPAFVTQLDEFIKKEVSTFDEKQAKVFEGFVDKESHKKAADIIVEAIKAFTPDEAQRKQLLSHLDSLATQ